MAESPGGWIGGMPVAGRQAKKLKTHRRRCLWLIWLGVLGFYSTLTMTRGPLLRSSAASIESLLLVAWLAVRPVALGRWVLGRWKR